MEHAGAELERAVKKIRQAKRDGDLALAISAGKAALALSPTHFTVLIELCTVYLVAMPRLGKAKEHANRALPSASSGLITTTQERQAINHLGPTSNRSSCTSPRVVPL